MDTHSHAMTFPIRQQSHSKTMVIRGSTFTAYIDTLTRNTCVMMIISDPSISKIEMSNSISKV